MEGVRSLVEAPTLALLLLLPGSLGCAPKSTTTPSDSTSPEPAPKPIAEPTPRGESPEPDRPGPLGAVTLAEWASSVGSIHELLHPEHGLFVIHNISGSMPHLELVDRWPPGEESMLTDLLGEDDLETLRLAGQWEVEYRPPGTDGECDPGSPSLGDAASPSGWVLDIHLGMRESEDEGPDPPPWITQPYEVVSSGDFTVAELGSGLEFTQWDARRWERLQRLDGAVTRVAYLEHSALFFGVLDGHWYLVGIDAYDDACG